MKIKKLTASFGKLNNETITFHDGLNVINLPNESGKSTWCAFIQAMLYGIDTSERVKSGYIPDKQKYSPWSGAVMEGTMELEHKGKNITISRTTTSALAPMRDFSAKYTGTNNDVADMSSSSAGEILTGVNKEVFERSAYFKQGSASISSNTELEKRILSLYSTGEESVSYSSSDERLKAWKRKRRYNGRGILPEIENELDSKNEVLEKIIKGTEALSNLEQKELEMQSEISDLEDLMSETKRISRNKMLADISKARDDVIEKSRDQNKALERVNTVKNSIKESAFGIKKESDAVKESEEDLSLINELEKNKMPKGMLIASIVLFAMAIAGAIIFETVFQRMAIAASAAVGAILAVIFLLVFQKKKRVYISSIDKINLLLKKYKVKNKEEITEVLNGYLKLCDELYNSMNRYKTTCDAFDKSQILLKNLESRLLSGDENSETASLNMRAKSLRDAQAQLSMDIASEKGKMITLGDPLVIRGEIDNLEKLQGEVEKEYDAISLAIEVLKNANEEIQNKFSPLIGKKAAEYMSLMTDGKYGEVLLNRDFSAMTKTSNDTVAHESTYLSAGTSDLLYIAIKLAICEVVLPKEENCPIILDDALVNLDNERYEKAISLLLQIAKKRQVIVFTCRRN